MSLPKGFKRLKYIQSSGEQYIDTGFVPNNNSCVIMDAEFLSTPDSSSWLFGCRSATSSKVFDLLWHASGYFRSGYNAANTQRWQIDATTRRVYKKDKETTTIDGTAQSYENATFNCAYNLYLMALSSQGSPAGYAAAKLYSCQIYDNGAMILDYIPCQNTSGAVGLWDDVNSEFYGNAGTGEFIAGPVVQTVPPAPENFHIAIRSSTQIMLAWDAVDGAAGYLLYQNGVCVEDTQFTDYTVDVQPFEKYSFELMAYNEHGLGAAAVLEFSFAPDNPTVALVTDRTAADAAAGNEKGRYTAVDLNRVGAVVQYLVRRLQATGMTISLSPKTDWAARDWVTPASAAAYLADVQTLRGALKLAESVPQAPEDLEAFTYAEANNIELILLALEVHITNMRGTLDAGWAAGIAHTGLYAKEAY